MELPHWFGSLFHPARSFETVLIRNKVQLNIAENHNGLYVIGIYVYLANKKLKGNSVGFYGSPMLSAPSLLFFCSTILSSGIYSQGRLKVQYDHYSSAIKSMFQAPGRKKSKGKRAVLVSSSMRVFFFFLLKCYSNNILPIKWRAELSHKATFISKGYWEILLLAGNFVISNNCWERRGNGWEDGKWQPLPTRAPEEV